MLEGHFVMGGNSILAYFFRPVVTRGETLTWGGFSGGKFYTGGIFYATTPAVFSVVQTLR